MVNCFQHKHGLNAGRAISARLAALASPVMVQPGADAIIIKPEGDTSALSESFVIVFPVTDAVLQFVFSHKLNITALPHPLLFMQQRRVRGDQMSSLIQ